MLAKSGGDDLAKVLQESRFGSEKTKNATFVSRTSPITTVLATAGRIPARLVIVPTVAVVWANRYPSGFADSLVEKTQPSVSKKKISWIRLTEI